MTSPPAGPPPSGDPQYPPPGFSGYPGGPPSPGAQPGYPPPGHSGYPGYPPAGYSGYPGYPPPGYSGYPGYPPPGYSAYPPPGYSPYPPAGYAGYPGPSRAKVSAPVTGWAILACGLLGVIGSVTPWASVDFLGMSQTVSGTDASDGKLSIVCAGIVAVMGLLIALRVGHLWTSIVALVFAVFVALIGFADFGSINGDYGALKDEHVPDGVVSVGYGIWLVIFSGVLGIVAAIVAMVRRA